MLTTSLTLLERLRDTRDEAAWARLVDLYTPLLFACARRCGENEHDAADLIQEVLSALMQILPTFQYDRGGKFRGLLRTLLLNKLRDRKRREVRLHRALKELPGEQELPSNVEAFWEEDFRLELARRALQLMKDEFTHATWRACWETVVEGRSTAEVAQELGLSENAVYISRCRVLRRLRQELAGMLD
jgi:RNA polymerase sigma-70 factor (ECF subfamily)